MLSRVEELKLLARCVLGDSRDAFGQIVEAYRSDIIRFFLNLTMGDGALSDDLAQETFIKAYLGIRGFRGLSKFRTWLYRIAYNEYYTYLRKRHEEHLGDDAVADNLLADGHGAANDAHIDVYTAMQWLSEQQRAVVTLFYIEDLPIRKISDITGMPQGTVKSHLNRAKTKLAQLLEKDTKL